MEEFCARLGFVKELQALGHSNDEIKRLLADHFSRGEGSSKQAYGDFSSNSSSDEEEANFSSSGVDL
jgi:DNA-binding transcriptional MerR regulator